MLKLHSIHLAVGPTYAVLKWRNLIAIKYTLIVFIITSTCYLSNKVEILQYFAVLCEKCLSEPKGRLGVSYLRADCTFFLKHNINEIFLIGIVSYYMNRVQKHLVINNHRENTSFNYRTGGINIKAWRLYHVNVDTVLRLNVAHVWKGSYSVSAISLNRLNMSN